MNGVSPFLKKSSGFTLIEVMVVVGLVSVLAALAAPSWSDLVTSNQIRSAVNEWNASVQFARSEALRQNSPVTMCPSSDGATCTAGDYEVGWIVRTGTAVANANDRILQDTLPKANLTMAVVAPSKRITILPNGQPIGNFAGARITVRGLEAADDHLNKTICIGRSGRARVFTEAQYMALPANTCTS